MLHKLNRNMPCWCGSGKKYKACHMDFDQQIDEFRRIGCEVPKHKLLKNAEQVEGIRRSAKINMAALDAVAAEIRPGMATSEINRIVHEVTVGMGGIPAPLNYHGFPFSVCTSVNEQVCHGFPSEKVILKEGDIINVDCSTILDGYYSDSSRMFCIGEVSPEKQKLVDVTKECVELGLQQVKPWTLLGAVGEAVKTHAHANGYTVVRDIGGHGCGLEFHEDPFVSFVSNRDEGMLMVPGMTFTIEPMVNMGTWQHVTNPANGWEISTRDGQPSAQWEIMVLVTETGWELLSW